MRKKSVLLGIHAKVPLMLRVIYSVGPFLIGFLLYHIASDIYLQDNPRGKIMPSFIMMAERFWEFAAVFDTRTQSYLLLADTHASLTRLCAGTAAAALVGLLVGINIAMFPALRYMAQPWITALSFVPIVTTLPILLIVLGIGEEAKITFIFLGVVFIVISAMVTATREVPQELIIKALTLGASQLSLVYTVVLPMVLPRLVEAIRSNLGIVWVCLIVGEGIASAEGLGYRIFLLRRTSDMAGIIPYVIWITLLASAIYFALGILLQVFFPWKYERGRLATILAGVPKNALFALSNKYRFGPNVVLKRDQ